jgi:hemoglobin
MADIETRDDVERLVRAFYEKAMTDPMIGFLFTDVARLDLDEHLPVITSFWETMLLGAKSYAGGAFAPHASLHRKAGLRAPHFERWLWLWRGTVDALFSGPVAEEAKAHANRVGAAFYRRLAMIDAGEPVDPQRSDPLAITHHGGPARAQP